ncbi:MULTISPECIES: hypothetical protein [unclassified Lacinutrix]
MMRCAVLKLIFFGVLFFLVPSSFGQQKEGSIAMQYLDSAEVYIDEFPKKAVAYLDVIPEPIEENLKGKVAKYYKLKAISNNALNQQAEIFNNFLLALKYAEIEKDYDTAGMSSLELFYNIYSIKEDTTAMVYLDKAKTYYELGNNKNGLTEVEQMYAYIEFQNKNYKKSNALLLAHLEDYKSIKEDGYYYMYALFMLISNYLDLNDLEHAKQFFQPFERLRNDVTISPSLYKKHEVTLYNCFAERYFKNKKKDSLKIYLDQAEALRLSMNDADVENYFKLKSNYYDEINNIEFKNNYVDSLKDFHQRNLKETLDASLKINKTLINTENNLREESSKKKLNRNAMIILGFVLLVFIVFVSVKNNKIKQKIGEFTKKKEEYTYMQTNHEKLQVKVRGLEDYLNDVKKEIKSISKINDTPKQRERIKELYKDLHLNSSTVLDKSKNHLELVNDLNIDFFNTMNSKHPELDDSEIIICYYLHIGFKNKEIAVFLNRSLRSIENKRFRIGKKIHLKATNLNLLEYLNALFEENKKVV